MNTIGFIVQIYELLSYHIVFLILYYLITNMDYEQRRWFRILTFYYPVVITIAYRGGVFGLSSLWLYEQLFYSLSVLLIYAMGDNDLYFLLGISSLMFISEFYEIPIYVLRYNRMNWFRLSDMSSLFSIGIIISKILTGFYVVAIMRLLRFDYKRFKPFIVLYIGAYLILSYFYVDNLYTIARNMYFNSGIILKCVFFISMLIFIYVSDTDKYGVIYG